METRHEFALQQKIDQLMDTGITTITTTEFMRFNGKSKIGRRMKRDLTDKILKRVEGELDASTKVLVYDFNGSWTFVLKDECLSDLEQWSGKDE